jgi:hypothetical protein
MDKDTKYIIECSIEKSTSHFYSHLLQPIAFGSSNSKRKEIVFW